MVRNDLWKARSTEDRTRGARAHLVLQPLEVHDVRVDGDPDRHDDAGDAGERQREADRLAEEGDERVDRHPGEDEPDDHDQAEQAVEDEHVERDQREPDDAGGDAGVELVLAERRRHVLRPSAPRAAPAARRS